MLSTNFLHSTAGGRCRRAGNRTWIFENRIRRLSENDISPGARASRPLLARAGGPRSQGERLSGSLSDTLQGIRFITGGSGWGPCVES